MAGTDLGPQCCPWAYHRYGSLHILPTPPSGATRGPEMSTGISVAIPSPVGPVGCPHSPSTHCMGSSQHGDYHKLMLQGADNQTRGSEPTGPKAPLRLCPHIHMSQPQQNLTSPKHTLSHKGSGKSIDWHSTQQPSHLPYPTAAPTNPQHRKFKKIKELHVCKTHPLTL